MLFPPRPAGFTASQLAGQVQASVSKHRSQYGARRAAYDLKKLRGKQIVRRIGRTADMSPLPRARAMAALVVLRDKAIKPLLAAAQELRPSDAAESHTLDALRHDSHGHARRLPGTGPGRMNIDNYFVGLRP